MALSGFEHATIRLEPVLWIQNDPDPTCQLVSDPYPDPVSDTDPVSDPS